MFLSYTVILQYVELRLQVLAAQAVSDGLRDAKAANTLRVYQTAWHLFCEWTLLTDRQSMPAEPQTVAVYLGHLAADGKAMATIEQAEPRSPTPMPPRAYRRAITRPPSSRGRGPQGLAQSGSNAQTGRRTRHRCPGPHPGDYPPSETRPRGRMESEAAALTWNDVEFWPDGTARITIQKGKNQPEPATVAVTETTARALRDIQPDDTDPAASLFGLTGETLANRIRAAARAAGLGEAFSGHSGRIGIARRMVAAGAPTAAVQNQGRWKHGDMVARYTRGEVAGEALKWLT